MGRCSGSTPGSSPGSSSSSSSFNYLWVLIPIILLLVIVPIAIFFYKYYQNNYQAIDTESDESSYDIYGVELSFITMSKGKSQKIDRVHEVLMEKIMKIKGFEDKIYEKSVMINSEKKGTVTFILKASVDTAMEDEAIKSVLALLNEEKAQKRVKKIRLCGLDDPIKKKKE